MRLPFLRRAVSVPAPPEVIGGVPVRVSARAKRMALRADARSGRIMLVLPRRQTWTSRMQQAALDFVTAHRDWIAAHDRPPQHGRARAGATVSVLGRDYVLVHQAGRGLSRCDGDTLVITGDAAHFDRRLRDTIKRIAAEHLPARVAEKTRQLGLPVRPVRLRDPLSRWGSCGSDGTIMLSWRLVLLPEFVMDYIVAHEVAHRVHMNHGRDFWRLCLSLTPRGGEARRWLRLHGQDVMRF